MDRDFVSRHIDSLAAAEHSLVAGGAIDACWPGGPADRSEPAALEWVRRWRPDRTEATLPLCSCWAGRCPVCN
jgi:hypothetical protein